MPPPPPRAQRPSALRRVDELDGATGRERGRSPNRGGSGARREAAPSPGSGTPQTRNQRRRVKQRANRALSDDRVPGEGPAAGAAAPPPEGLRRVPPPPPARDGPDRSNRSDGVQILNGRRVRFAGDGGGGAAAPAPPRDQGTHRDRARVPAGDGRDRRSGTPVRGRSRSPRGRSPPRKGKGRAQPHKGNGKGRGSKGRGSAGA